MAVSMSAHMAHTQAGLGRLQSPPCQWNRQRSAPRLSVETDAIKHSVNASAVVDAAVEMRACRSDATLDTPATSSLVAQLERDFGLTFTQDAPSQRGARILKQQLDTPSLGSVISTGTVRSQRAARRKIRHAAASSLAGAAGSVDGPESTCRFLQALEDEVASGRARKSGSSKRSSALDMHVRRMGSTRVLTRAEEKRLFEVYGCCAKLGLSCTGPNSRAQLLHAQTQHGVDVDVLQSAVAYAARARALLVQFNLRFVLATAKRYTGHGVALEDLIPEGEQGVLVALARFDPARGYRFSSYAAWYIRNQLQRMQRHGHVMRVPSSVLAKVPKVLGAREQLEGMRGAGRLVTNEDVADALGLPARKVQLIVRAMTPPAQLDAPTSTKDGPGEPLIDSIIDESTEGVAEEQQRELLVQERVDSVLLTLLPRERNVLRLRYGLNTDGRRVPLPEIADAYGLTLERIRQIEVEAVRKLMLPWRRDMLAQHVADGADVL